MNRIELRSISKSYGDVIAVEKVDLHVREGEFLTLLGPSGCGKTSTLRMIAGFVAPTSGAVVIDGSDVTSLAPFRREIGLVFQSYALFPHMTVAENVDFGLKMRKSPASERRRRVDEALAMVRLEAFGGRFPRELSGGQQQRVALARALVIRPRLLLLDEPFGALDRQLRDHMRIELRTLQKSLSLPTIFVTHDQGEALSMSDRVAVMNAGRIEQIGPPSEIYERPNTAFVATFLGRSNVLELDVIGREGKLLKLARGPLRISAHADGRTSPSGKQAVMIRPERIELRRAVGDQRSENEAVISMASYLGASIESVAALGDLTLAVSTYNRGGDAFRPAEGDRVILDIPPDAVWPLDGLK